MATTIELPIATAWMYMSDDQHYNTIPPAWSAINFKDVDVLNVGPAGIQFDGSFGLYNSSITGDLANRFKWILQTARTQNPKIKIIVSQWWGSGDGTWGNTLDSLKTGAAISKYADSVVAFLRSYLNVSGGVDGYDIDYEDNNVVSTVPAILSQIRSGLDALSKENGGRSFYLSVSPANITYLKEAVNSLNFVNMQNYEGGSYLNPPDYLALGLNPWQLLYGICPETGCQSKSLEAVKAEYARYKLAGIHLWRLNSGNYEEEGRVQAQVYRFLHPG